MQTANGRNPGRIMASLTAADELRVAVVSAVWGVDFDRYPGDRSFGLGRRRLAEVCRKLDGS
jgi:hypothetical protein